MQCSLSSLLALAALASCAASTGPITEPETHAAGPASAAEPAGTSEPETVDDFALLDEAGRFHALYEQSDARAVVLLPFAVGSPTVARNAGLVEEIARAQGERGVRFFYVDSLPLDGRDAIAGATRELGVTLPVLCDPNQWVGSSLGLERMAEALLVDTRDWSAAWRGPIHDGEGAALGEALAALLAERPLPTARPAYAAVAESIPLEELPAPAYAADVVPILARRCLECHSTGGIAPWAMSSWERVRGWSPAIREAVLTRRMPPWHADPHFGTFSNDRGLTGDEGRTLLAWIEAGSPRGDGADELPALSSTARSEWPLGEPDIVLEAKRVDVPATGLVPYVYDTVKVDVDHDVWVRATEVRPSNRRILHHAQIYVRYPKALKAEQPEFKGKNVFSWYVPGVPAHEYPAGTGKRIPGGSKIIFELHYTTTGKVESDSTKLALYLLDSPPRIPFETIGAFPVDLRIPPFEPHHLATARRKIEHDSLLHSMAPHMHFRGRAMDYRAIYPDGTEEMLLSVPRFDFNWQTTYQLAEPKLLPAGTTIVCRAAFDNSARNPFNPDPTREVVWGEQTTDEMFIGVMNVHRVFPEPTQGPVNASARGVTNPSATDSE